MRRRQSSKGQAFLFIILLAIVIIAAFALLWTRFTRVRFAPIVQEAFWQVDEQRITTASVSSEVEATVAVKATEQYVGSIVIKIRKDVALWPDSDYHVLTVPVDLAGGEEKKIEFTFVPDESSDGGLRGYFIEVDFLATRTKWVMENSYPPRLRVT